MAKRILSPEEEAALIAQAERDRDSDAIDHFRVVGVARDPGANGPLPECFGRIILSRYEDVVKLIGVHEGQHYRLGEWHARSIAVIES